MMKRTLKESTPSPAATGPQKRRKRIAAFSFWSFLGRVQGFALFIFLLITGCQTGIFIKETPAPLTEIRKAVVTVLGQPRRTSQNGRELTSEYHDKKAQIDAGLAKAKNRYFTVVTILGERRPYDIKVEVFQEARIENQTYEVIAEDLDLAQKLANQIETALNESLKNRNVIDDFKAF